MGSFLLADSFEGLHCLQQVLTLVSRIWKAHGLLGHGNEESTHQTAKQLGWAFTHGVLKPCLHCAKSKAKQKNVSKTSTLEKASKPGERIYLDLSKVTVSKSDDTEFEIDNKHWKIMVDKAMGKKWSDFTNSKSGMVERTCEFLHKIKSHEILVLHIHLDPAGENLKLEKRASSFDWTPLQPLEFEFTSQDTPQHNNLVELAFPYLAGQASAMMGATNVSSKN